MNVQNLMYTYMYTCTCISEGSLLTIHIIDTNHIMCKNVSVLTFRGCLMSILLSLMVCCMDWTLSCTAGS